MAILSRVVFTVEEANRTLPLLRSVVGDVADKWQELIRVREEYGNSSPEHDRIMRELADYVQELKTIGCHLKDFERGVVEFPALVDGKEVRLQWTLGEESVSPIDPREEIGAGHRPAVAEVDPEEEEG